MITSIILDPDARIDFKDASDWYLAHDETAMLAFVDVIRTTLEAIALSPNSYPVVFGSNTRKAVVKRFPYTIFFSVEEDIVFVHAIFHTSRNPIIWRGRIG